MSLYNKIPVWGPTDKTKYNRVKQMFEGPIIKRPQFKSSILDGPIIRGAKNILTRDEKLLQSKPKNRFEYERQFKKYHDKDFLKSFKGFEGW